MPELDHFDFGEGLFHGAMVIEVAAGSAAEAAGVKTGDLIETVDGEPLDEPGALAELIATYEPGDEVELAIRRDGEKLTVDAVLGTSPDDETAAFLGVTTHIVLHWEKHTEGDGEGHELDHLRHRDEMPFPLSLIDRFRSQHYDFDFDFHWPEDIEPELHLDMPSPIWFTPGASEV